MTKIKGRGIKTCADPPEKNTQILKGDRETKKTDQMELPRWKGGRECWTLTQHVEGLAQREEKLQDA